MIAADTIQFEIDSAARTRILAAFYRDGQNTCEIGKALGINEAEVAEVVRAERERRIAIYAGSRG